MTLCKGCGIPLQYTDPNAPGYCTKKDALYCKRCFRLTHYGDLTNTIHQGMDEQEVMDRLEKVDGNLVWVVDLFDLESAWIAGLAKRFENRKLLFVGTKRDLLPESINNQRLARYLFSRLKQQNISVSKMIFTGFGYEDSHAELLETMHSLCENKPLYIFGRANAGKSTLLNRLLKKDTLTTSYYPGTTLEFNTITNGEDTWVDTPGMLDCHGISSFVKKEDYTFVIPKKTVKPRIFQIYEDQTYFLGGLIRMDVIGCHKACVTWYLSESLYLHRTNLKNADALYKNQFGKLFIPVSNEKEQRMHVFGKKEEKMDVVIQGLGWACLSGDIKQVKVYGPKGLGIQFRKAMI